jgi:hypothetical protein
MSSRDNNVRDVEAQARKRMQDEIARLRDALKTISTGDFNHFLQRTGHPATYNGGQLVQWQVINIAAQAIK